MSLFSKRPAEVSREYKTQYWDQRLYECLFKGQSENQKVLGHYFGCQLSERTTKISPGSGAGHMYRGRIRLQVGEFEYCVILVDLQFDKPDSYFNVPMNDVNVGYASFGWATDKRVHPQLCIQVKDANGLSEQVARAYAEAKASRNDGLEVVWSMVVTSIIGSSANEVWGEWPNDSPRNEAGELVMGKFPGLHAFQLGSIEFSAQS